MSWFVYIIEANDNSLYTGITTDLQRRFDQHASGQGAKFLKADAPLDLFIMKTLIIGVARVYEKQQ